MSEGGLGPAGRRGEAEALPSDSAAGSLPSHSGFHIEKDDSALVEKAEQLAAGLMIASERFRGRSEQRRSARVTRLLEDPLGFEFVLALTDEVMRIRDQRRAARHFAELVRGTGSPRFLGPVDRAAVLAGTRLATALPGIVMPLVKARVRAEVSGYVLDAERQRFARHAARRRRQGISLNVNLLGEAILGDDEAERRLQAVLDLLSRPEVDYVSVKISSICAQLNPLAFDTEVARISRPLRRLYVAAGAYSPAKFVNLDMEEYRDLDLTVAAFKSVLSEDAFSGLDAGIVLQAYLPDSLPALEDLCAWARTRRARCGGTIKIRIVKGANLAMETVEAEIAGWPAAPFATKAEVDAHYKRMLDAALIPDNRGAVRLGVASHNLFEIAWALTLAEERGLPEMVEIEMLEGMAAATALAVREAAGRLLLYAPIARRSDSESVIAYLVRRFDENTGPENFLRHQFSLEVGSPEWERQRRRFRAAVAERRLPAPPPRRCQNRLVEEAAPSFKSAGGAERAQGERLPGSLRDEEGRGVPQDEEGRGDPQGEEAVSAEEGTADGRLYFCNEPDTDFALAVNRRWAAGHLRRAKEGTVLPAVVPAAVAGRTVEEPAAGTGVDPSRPGRVAYRWVDASVELVEEAVRAANRAARSWAALRLGQRQRLLLAAAEGLARMRGKLIACMAADTGKTVAEADPEVSEAIDHARYCAASIDGIAELCKEGAGFSPLGTVAVVPPWNFPLAIPACGVFAALAAGNSVVLKPAPESVATAFALAEACWAAGVPRDALQFLPCSDGEAGKALITHPGIAAVVLTGSWATALMFLRWRPSLRLHAETSGKNAIVVTAAADLDAAVADITRSAFGHAGQKCSAASLAILEASVYDDRRFRRQLADAVRTLRPGPAWELETTIGPLIRPPQGPLLRSLFRLDSGEQWLVEPREVGGNPHLWSPGVKLGVRPGSFFHLTECFGPVLGLMRASSLAEATAWQNQTPYGLTAGLHSLDPAEIAWWRERVEAGNLYVNRHTTGAIVRRQPFGGWKRSVVGPGAKPGGPNYVASLGTWRADFNEGPEAFGAAVAKAWRQRLAPSDPTGLKAEANVLRYRPLRAVLLRVGPGAEPGDVALALAAARATGVAVEVSCCTPIEGLASSATVETEDALLARLRTIRADKLRLLGEVGDDLRLAAHEDGWWVDEVSVTAHPVLEALRWAREQAVSETLHRYGNVTNRRPGLPRR